MADIDKSFDAINKEIQKMKEQQENQMLDMRSNYQNMIAQVISDAQQEAIVHRETLEKRYQDAYDDIEGQLQLKFKETLKQVESKLDSLRNEVNNRMDDAQRQLDENINRVDKFGQGQKERLECEKQKSHKSMEEAYTDLDRFEKNCFAKILYGGILSEYKKMYRNIENYFDKKFYQSVVASSLSLSRECNVKECEIKDYMEMYVRRICALRREVKTYQSLLEDNYRKADLYGDAICKKHKRSKTKMDESFIDYWSNGIYSVRMSKLVQALSFLEEHGIDACKECDENAVLERIQASLEAADGQKKLVEYIKNGYIIVYDMEKMIRDEISTLENEPRIYEKVIERYNDRLEIEGYINDKLEEYQYSPIETSKKLDENCLDPRIGVSLKYKNKEDLKLEICVISIKNNYKNDIENKIAVVVDYDELGIMAEQYIQDIKSILKEISLLKDYVIENWRDSPASAKTKYADMQRMLYDKCNPYGRL